MMCLNEELAASYSNAWFTSGSFTQHIDRVDYGMNINKIWSKYNSVHKCMQETFSRDLDDLS